MEFFQGTTLVGTSTQSPYSVLWDTTRIANGQYTLTSKAFDAANNSATSAPSTVTVNNPSTDTIPPTTSMTAPANGATVAGTIAVSANATDNMGVTKVEFYRATTLIGTDTSSPYSISWNTTTTTNGNHSLTSKAFDAANNIGTSAPITVTVNNLFDTSGPTLTVTPANNSTLPTKGSFSIMARASDPSGVSKIYIYLDNLLIKTCAGITTCSKNQPVSQITKGTHTIKAIAADNSAAKNTTTITNTVTKP